MSQTAAATHKSAISELIRRYAAAGYVVTEQPQLPEFMSQNYRPDLVAKRNGETVVIAVKVAPGQKLDGPRWSSIAETVQAIPGWRFVLAVAYQDDTMAELELPSPESIRQRIQQLRGSSDLPVEAALLYAWSLLESAARLAFLRQGAPPERLASPKSIVDSLIFRGLLSQEAGRELHALARIRNQLAHGVFSTEISRQSVLDVALRAEELLNEESVR